MLFLEQTAPANLCGSRVEFQGMGDHLASVIKGSLNLLSASYLDVQYMCNGRMSRCYINITRILYVYRKNLAKM